jgi:hypothetical protein
MKKNEKRLKILILKAFFIFLAKFIVFFIFVKLSIYRSDFLLETGYFESKLGHRSHFFKC